MNTGVVRSSNDQKYLHNVDLLKGHFVRKSKKYVRLYCAIEETKQNRRIVSIIDIGRVFKNIYQYLIGVHWIAGRGCRIHYDLK